MSAFLPFLLQTVTFAAPILLPALGATLSERAGVVNIGLEGLMLVGALAAVIAGAAAHSAAIGVIAAALAGVALAALFALFGIVLARDQVIVGVTINFLALGLTGVLYRAWVTRTRGAAAIPHLPAVVLDWDPLTILAILLVPLTAWLLFRTRVGVTLRAAGEVPVAAAAAGSRVNRMRFCLVLVTGALCGAAGAALSIGILNTFTEGITGGRGFIALAVVVFGRWSPFGALGAALLFAAAEVGQARLQAAGFQGIPYPVFLALPYLLTLAALALRGASTRPPAALGQPFEQG